jgi:hypothetical protein
MKLINEKTLEEVCIGDVVYTLRGESGILRSSDVPHKPSSTGRVYIEFNGTMFVGSLREYFPSVIGCKFIPK